MPQPLVTIAIACRDEAARIEVLVRAAQTQDWPRDRLQIVVADGMSMDATREVLARLAEEDDRIELVENPDRGRAAGLNECLRRARGELVVRMDVGADYSQDYVQRCATALDRTGADTVDGSARPKGRSFLQRCVAAALRSPLGVGRGADGPDDGWADGVRPAAFRREVFERAGLFDARSVADEDAELRRRITSSGGRVERTPELDAEFSPRDSVPALARRSFGYGKGRARTLLKHGRFSSWGPTLPLLWLVGEVALAAAAPRRAFLWSLAAYALATGAEAIRVSRQDGALSVPVVWALFPVLHVAHGAGFASGLARYVLEPDWETDDRLEPLEPGAQAARAATA
jgi:cellulose synthase/poly-beta-1,6-N-acetylglucosamine synthase-like glycosyltransferase